MLKWLKRAFGRSIATAPQADDRTLLLEREIQGLRLELEESARSVSTLKGELERQRQAHNVQLTESLRAHGERLIGGVATPVAQLATQAHLLEVESRPVQAKDVLTVAKNLVRALEAEGMALEGRIGEETGFDPNHHEALADEVPISVGDTVVIRFAGVTYRGKLVRKAGVDRGCERNADQGRLG